MEYSYQYQYYNCATVHSVTLLESQNPSIHLVYSPISIELILILVVVFHDHKSAWVTVERPNVTPHASTALYSRLPN